MKRVLLLAAASTAALLLVAWARGSGSPLPTPPTAPSDAQSALPAPSPSAGFATGGASRNVFEYGRDERSARPAALAEVRRLPAHAQEAAPSPEAVRLVGVFRRSGEARAALSILGEVVVLAPGEVASGYTLLAVDEDAGARLRGPSGAEVVARPAH